MLVITGATAIGVFLQRAETLQLRAERELGRMEVRDADRLRSENRRLRKTQLPPGELEALRADHAALIRLRAELEALHRSDQEKR